MTILCPFDFSKGSVRALKYAFELAEEMNGNVTVLYSYRLIQPDHNGQILSFRREKEAQVHREFQEVLASLDKKAPFRFVIEIGFLSDSVANHIRKNHIDMLVLGREMCNAINDHKEYALDVFLNNLTIPVVIVPVETVPV